NLRTLEGSPSVAPSLPDGRCGVVSGEASGMRRRLLPFLVTVAVAGSGPVALATAHGSANLVSDGVTASVSGATASLTDGLITRRWSLGPAGVQTTALTSAGQSWSRPGPD